MSLCKTTVYILYSWQNICLKILSFHEGTKLKQDNGTEYKTSKSKGGRRSSSAGLVSRGHSSENDNSLADQISEVDHEKELLKNPTQSRKNLLKKFNFIKNFSIYDRNQS